MIMEDNDVPFDENRHHQSNSNVPIHTTNDIDTVGGQSQSPTKAKATTTHDYDDDQPQQPQQHDSDCWTAEQTNTLARALLYNCMKNTPLKSSGNLYSGGLGVAYLQYLYSSCQQLLQEEEEQEQAKVQPLQTTKSKSSAFNATFTRTTSSSGSVYRSKKFLLQALESALTESLRQLPMKQRYQTLLCGDYVGAQTLVAMCHLKLGNVQKAKDAGVQLLKRLSASYTSSSLQVDPNDHPKDYRHQQQQHRERDNSVLYGRAGTLQTIWMLRQEYQKPTLASKLVVKITCQILQDAIPKKMPQQQHAVFQSTDNKDDNNTILLWPDDIVTGKNTNTYKEDDEEEPQCRVQQNDYHCRLGSSKGVVGILTTLLGLHPTEWQLVEQVFPNAFRLIQNTIDQFLLSVEQQVTTNDENENLFLYPSGNLRPIVTFSSSSSRSKVIMKPLSPSKLSSALPLSSKKASTYFDSNNASPSKTSNVQETSTTSVDWANGGAGLVLLFVKASQVFQSKKYLLAAHSLADKVLWPRCFQLQKGVGLAYGCSGIAWSMLELSYVCKGSLAKLWQDRVEQVAKQAIVKWDDYLNLEQTYNSGWNVYSLYEGMGGLVSLLVAISFLKKRIQKQSQQHSGRNTTKTIHPKIMMHMPLYSMAVAEGYCCNNENQNGNGTDFVCLEFSDIPLPVPRVVLKPEKAPVPMNAPSPPRQTRSKQKPPPPKPEDPRKHLPVLPQQEREQEEHEQERDKQQEGEQEEERGKQHHRSLHYEAAKKESAFFSLEQDFKIGSERYTPALVVAHGDVNDGDCPSPSDDLTAPPPPRASRPEDDNTGDASALLWVLPNVPTASTLTACSGVPDDGCNLISPNSIPTSAWPQPAGHQEAPFEKNDQESEPEQDSTTKNRRRIDKEARLSTLVLVDTSLHPSEGNDQPILVPSSVNSNAIKRTEVKDGAKSTGTSYSINITKKSSASSIGEKKTLKGNAASNGKSWSSEKVAQPCGSLSRNIGKSHTINVSEKKVEKKDVKTMGAAFEGTSQSLQKKVQPRVWLSRNPNNDNTNPKKSSQTTESSENQIRQCSWASPAKSPSKPSAPSPSSKISTRLPQRSSARATRSSEPHIQLLNGVRPDHDRRDTKKVSLSRVKKNLFRASSMESTHRPQNTTRKKPNVEVSSRLMESVGEASRRRRKTLSPRVTPLPVAPNKPRPLTSVKASKSTLPGLGAKVRMTRAEQLRLEQQKKKQAAGNTEINTIESRRKSVEDQRKQVQYQARLNADKQRKLREAKLAKIQTEKEARQAAERVARKKQEDEARLKVEREKRNRVEKVARMKMEREKKRNAKAKTETKMLPSIISWSNHRHTLEAPKNLHMDFEKEVLGETRTTKKNPWGADKEKRAFDKATKGIKTLLSSIDNVKSLPRTHYFDANEAKKVERDNAAGKETSTVEIKKEQRNGSETLEHSEDKQHKTDEPVRIENELDEKDLFSLEGSECEEGIDRQKKEQKFLGQQVEPRLATAERRQIETKLDEEDHFSLEGSECEEGIDRQRKEQEFLGQQVQQRIATAERRQIDTKLDEEDHFSLEGSEFQEGIDQQRKEQELFGQQVEHRVAETECLPKEPFEGRKEETMCKEKEPADQQRFAEEERQRQEKAEQDTVSQAEEKERIRMRLGKQTTESRQAERDRIMSKILQEVKYEVARLRVAQEMKGDLFQAKEEILNPLPPFDKNDSAKDASDHSSSGILSKTEEKAQEERVELSGSSKQSNETSLLEAGEGAALPAQSTQQTDLRQDSPKAELANEDLEANDAGEVTPGQQAIDQLDDKEPNLVIVASCNSDQNQLERDLINEQSNPLGQSAAIHDSKQWRAKEVQNEAKPTNNLTGEITQGDNQGSTTENRASELRKQWAFRIAQALGSSSGHIKAGSFAGQTDVASDADEIVSKEYTGAAEEDGLLQSSQEKVDTNIVRIDTPSIVANEEAKQTPPTMKADTELRNSLVAAEEPVKLVLADELQQGSKEELSKDVNGDAELEEILEIAYKESQRGVGSYSNTAREGRVKSIVEVEKKQFSAISMELKAEELKTAWIAAEEDAKRLLVQATEQSGDQDQRGRGPMGREPFVEIDEKQTSTLSMNATSEEVYESIIVAKELATSILAEKGERVCGEPLIAEALTIGEISERPLLGGSSHRVSHHKVEPNPTRAGEGGICQPIDGDPGAAEMVIQQSSEDWERKAETRPTTGVDEEGGVGNPLDAGPKVVGTSNRLQSSGESGHKVETNPSRVSIEEDARIAINSNDENIVSSEAVIMSYEVSQERPMMDPPGYSPKKAISHVQQSPQSSPKASSPVETGLPAEVGSQSYDGVPACVGAVEATARGLHLHPDIKQMVRAKDREARMKSDDEARLKTLGLDSILDSVEVNSFDNLIAEDPKCKEVEEVTCVQASCNSFWEAALALHSRKDN